MRKYYPASFHAFNCTFSPGNYLYNDMKHLSNFKEDNDSLPFNEFFFEEIRVTAIETFSSFIDSGIDLVIRGHHC